MFTNPYGNLPYSCMVTGDGVSFFVEDASVIWELSQTQVETKTTPLYRIFFYTGANVKWGKNTQLAATCYSSNLTNNQNCVCLCWTVKQALKVQMKIIHNIYAWVNIMDLD